MALEMDPSTVKMEVVEGLTKRNSDELSTDSGESAPQSPKVKRACSSLSAPSSPKVRRAGSSFSAPSSPVFRPSNPDGRTTRSQTVKIVSLTKEQLLANCKSRIPQVTVDSLSEQITGLAKCMQDFKAVNKRENAQNTEELKKSIQEIAGVIPRVATLESNVKILNKDITAPKTGLKVRVSTLEGDVRSFQGNEKNVKKLQDGFRGMESRLQTGKVCQVG